MQAKKKKKKTPKNQKKSKKGVVLCLKRGRDMSIGCYEVRFHRNELFDCFSFRRHMLLFVLLVFIFLFHNHVFFLLSICSFTLISRFVLFHTPKLKSLVVSISSLIFIILASYVCHKQLSIFKTYFFIFFRDSLPIIF